MTRSNRRCRRALIVEGQRLMMPLLRDVLARAGLDDVVLARSATTRALRSARPDVIVLDAESLGARSLAFIRAARAATAARIVLITRRDDPAWNALARALGADVILGARADRHDLLSAVAASSAAAP